MTTQGLEKRRKELLGLEQKAKAPALEAIRAALASVGHTEEVTTATPLYELAQHYDNIVEPGQFIEQSLDAILCELLNTVADAYFLLDATDERAARYLNAQERANWADGILALQAYGSIDETFEAALSIVDNIE